MSRAYASDDKEFSYMFVEIKLSFLVGFITKFIARKVRMDDALKHLCVLIIRFLIVSYFSKEL